MAFALSWPCTSSVNSIQTQASPASFTQSLPVRRIPIYLSLNQSHNVSSRIGVNVRIGYSVSSLRKMGWLGTRRRKTSLSYCRKRFKLAVPLYLMEDCEASGLFTDTKGIAMNAGGSRTELRLRMSRRFEHVRGKTASPVGKERRPASYQAQALKSGFVPFLEAKNLGRRRAQSFVQEWSSGLLKERMIKRQAEVSVFMAVVGDQLGRYLSVSRGVWRLCTQAAGKRQVDLSNRVNDEGPDSQSSSQATKNTNAKSDTGELPSKVTKQEKGVNGNKISPSTNLAMATVEATLAAEVSTDELLEAALGKNWGKNKLDSEQGQQDSPKRCMEGPQSVLQDEELLRKAALADNAEAAMAIIADKAKEPAGVLSNEECSQLIRAALAESNVDLAFSVLNAMRISQIQRRIDMDKDDNDRGASKVGWRWAQPDVRTYIALVRGLALSLRVTDAIQSVNDVRRRGIPAGDEVPFGKVVKCPTCSSALAVVQPHHGIQLVPCSKCRYQYELISGDVVSCESESISMNISAFERGLRVLQFMKKPLPAAVHSLVVRAPDGLARTHRFATESVDLPAQEGERITVASAAPTNTARGVGPLKVSARAPGWRPSEPMSITNHATGRISPLLRAPPKFGSGAALDTSVIIPAAFLLASSDAATALIDPTLPRTIAVGTAAAAALGTVANAFILPRLNQLPQRTVDAMALKQELLAQYELLQARLQELTQGAAEEVRMLARMCQLQNKMEAVREPAYSARIERVCKARVGLDERLAARLELIDSYAKISSMIEIEVEMDTDVLAAEAAGAVVSIAEQIERLMEVEDLQKQWKMQAEANDEVERLLRSSPLLPDST